jgi:hypothetical protein
LFCSVALFCSVVLFCSVLFCSISPSPEATRSL